MSRTPQFSVSGEEFIDNLIEENKKLKEYQYWAKDKIEGLQYENKKLKEDVEDHHKREIEDATDYVILFRKWAISSTLLLISLIMNFILIIW